jgi:CRISPR-associated protein Csm1
MTQNNDMDTTRQKIYLAALLHDIGKFYQRASNSKDKEQSNLSEQSKRMIEYVCPYNEQKKYHSHLHVL